MITNLLIFFAIPLAVVVISIALQKLLDNPFLVAGIIFSILLIIVLAFFDTIYLIAVVAYSVLSFLTAILACMLCRFLRNALCNGTCNDNSQNIDNDIITLTNNEGTSYCKSNNEFSGMTGTYNRKCNRRI